ncbi:MAG: hypothetical protein ABI858_08490, partial [Pseudoxanthomonas sp.]
PVAPELNAVTTVAVIAAIDAQSSMGSDVINDAAASPRLVRSPRHSRQPLAMPFFSFAPRS